MKLALKLTIAVMLVMAVLLLIHGFLVVERELDLFELDMVRHANIVGKGILALIPEFSGPGDEARLGEIIMKLNKTEPFLHIRLVNFGGDSMIPPRVDIAGDMLQSLLNGEKVMQKYKDAQGNEFLYAYFPTIIDGSKYFAIEIAESLAPMHMYVQNTIIRKIILFFAIVIFGSLLVLLLGNKMVGAPINKMVRLTVRVSEGDFNHILDYKKKNDELSFLATGLNKMVTKLKRSKERLEDETAQKLNAIEQLHHAERLATVGKLASGLAHELGTPLNVVSGRAKMISSEQLKPEEITESSRIIDEQAEKMTRIIRQLLDFARAKKPEKKPTNVDEMIEKVRSMLVPLANNKNVNIARKSSEALPEINIDSEQIQQVLTNIIINGIHAMPEGGDIKIDASQVETLPPADLGNETTKYIRINIADNGVGIPKENLSQIFAPFFSTKDIGKGTGLGLSISHGIVREHRGWIAVTSEEGKGSVFSIFLPLKDA